MDNIKYSGYHFDDLKLEYAIKTLEKYKLTLNCNRNSVIEMIEKLKEKRNELEDQISEYDDEIDDLLNVLDYIHIVDKFNSLGCLSFLVNSSTEGENEPS